MLKTHWHFATIHQGGKMGINNKNKLTVHLNGTKSANEMKK